MQHSFELCYITDRSGLQGRTLPLFLRDAIEAEVDMIQIREKDLGTRLLMELAKAAVSHAFGAKTQIVINDRLDVAMASQSAGVHLGGQSLPAWRVREVAPDRLLIGVSCHSSEDVRKAEAEGASYALLGPIFETPSKRAYGPPVGLRILERAASQSVIPVYAIGGITSERARACFGAGARGIAGIRIFQDAPSIRQCVQEIRRFIEPR
jgi:thiamine-phosphate pyrophosphorylase